MYRFFILVVVFFYMGLSGGHAQEILTLERALEVAFRYSPALLQSKLSLQQSELNLKAQKASLKSQFSLTVNPFGYERSTQYDNYNSKWYDNEIMMSSASLGIRQPIRWTDGVISLVNDFSWQDATNRTSGGKSTSYTHNASLRIEQPIFTYNRTKMQLRELELSLEKTRLNYAMQQLNIEKNVTDRFYGVYQQQRSLGIAREEFENQKQNYEIIKNKVEAGLVAREELFQAEVNLASSESSLYSQETNFENAKDDFKLLLGLSLDEDIVVFPNIETNPIAFEMDKAVQYGLTQRMELRQKEIVLEQDLFAVVRAKSENEFRGNISARIGLNALGSKVSNVYDNPTDNERIGITLEIPLFDWGAKKARVKSGELARESDEIDFAEQKKEIVITIRRICRNIPTLMNQISIRRKSVDNAQRTYEINLEKYKKGNLSSMDLQQYQTQLTSVKKEYTDAIIAYKLELLNLKVQTLWDFETNQSYLPVDLMK